MKSKFPRISGLVVAIVLTIALCAVFLTACDNSSDDEGEVQRDLYLYEIAFSEDEQTAYVYLTFSQTDEKIPDVTTVWTSKEIEKSSFYHTSETYIAVESARIFSAVQSVVPQDRLIYDGVQYNRLKVVIRYDTIYKSIKSDGEVSSKNRTYTHLFELDETAESQTFTLTLKSANAAGWYGTLLGCVLGAGLIVLIVYFVVKGRVWQKKKTRE